MKVTKYEHSCLVLEKAGDRLVIDPGSFFTPPDLHGVIAVVITHEHRDHWTPENLRRVLDASPKARLIGPQGVADAVRAEGPEDVEVEVVAAGDALAVDPFTLRFFGGRHNVIHSSVPVVDNVGVLVDDELYYGGDSYAVPDVPVGTLAAPVGAPWLKIGEAMDYVLEVAPRRAFPVHEMTLSVAGLEMQSARLNWATAQGGGDFLPLAPGESLDL